MFKKIYTVKLFVAILLSATMVFSSISTATDKYFYSSNDILFYDPDACVYGSGAGSGVSTKVSGNGNIEKIWNFFIGKGLKDHQAAGILGNIQAESGFSAFRHEDSQPWEYGGYGIVQWTGGRRDTLEAKMKEKIPDVHSKYYAPGYGKATSASAGHIPDGVDEASNDKMLGLQLELLYEEATTRPYRFDTSITEWEAIKAATILRESSDIWMRSFERPADQEEKARENRADMGQSILEKVTGKSNSGSGSNSSSDNSSGSGSDKDKILDKMKGYDKNTNPKEIDCDPNGSNPTAANGDISSLQALVKAWAWPKFEGNKKERRPAYIEAIEKAKSNGGFVGDMCEYDAAAAGGGVDCGGFVTRLMIDSGWDPNYYNDGKGNKYPGDGVTGTSGQRQYLEENWQSLGANVDATILKPGDVAIEPGHTFVFVGDIPGFGAKHASASQCQRAPMAGGEAITGPNIYWYRKK